MFKFYDDQINDEFNYKKKSIYEDTIKYINGSFNKRFKTIRVLGQGSTGLVKKVIALDYDNIKEYDKEYDREYAVKIVKTRDKETIQNVSTIIHYRPSESS